MLAGMLLRYHSVNVFQGSHGAAALVNQVKLVWNFR